MKGKKSEVLTEGTPGTVVEGGKVISSDAPGNTSFFGSLFGGQSSKPFQNQRALGLADILTLDRFDFDKRGSLFGPSDASGLGGPGDDFEISSSGIVKKKQSVIEAEKKKKEEEAKVPEFDKIFGMPFDKYLDMVSKTGEKAKNRDMLRSGISALAASPLIGSTAAMETAANISKLTGVNMAAIANQGDVMAQNPTKQRYAGKYFR